MDIMCAYLLMDRLVQGKLTQWYEFDKIFLSFMKNATIY